MKYNETIFPSEETMDTPFMTAPFRGKNAFWRYFVGVVAPFIAANVIGALPLAAVIITRTLEGSPMPQKGGMPDFEAMGINLNVGFVLNIIPFLLGLLTIILLV
ncbi:MAG: hypothetical protein GX646_05845, partial [Bacteroidales bacterium]|nr:hypothetical protein [Bacteroidales bacterium]